MKFSENKTMLLATSSLWLLLICTGVGLLWRYERTPGAAAATFNQWPADSRVRLSTDRATLVMLAHPHCPCTRASLGELARLMAQAEGRVTAYVLFVKPSGFPDGWEKTDLLATASAIPGVTVVRDDEGVEAGRSRAATSGQTMLYDAAGRLLFSGGITRARGHEGDNAGRAAVVSLLTTDEAGPGGTPVFGCPLFAREGECPAGKEVGRAKHEH
ncbi:MAG: RedB protein [Acidobacteria bacterium]|nr:RedB protein [Acidobacteriota bacterium]